MGILSDFLNLFYPNYCLGCARPLVKGEDTLCTHCLSQLPKTHHHTYSDNPVMQRLRGRLPLAHAFAFLHFRKHGMVQHLLHQLKYGNHPEVGVRLGNLYGWELAQAGLAAAFDLILPVPLHQMRQRSRGYNQSAKFAEGLSRALGVPWADAVSYRMAATATQTRKGRAARWQNVKDVFALRDAARVHNLRVLLVDDVITTGATLEACGHPILAAGCRSLSVACIAEA
jgi:ComF family protein